jgi:hypothetical protein
MVKFYRLSFETSLNFCRLYEVTYEEIFHFHHRDNLRCHNINTRISFAYSLIDPSAFAVTEVAWNKFFHNSSVADGRCAFVLAAPLFAPAQENFRSNIPFT